MYSCSSQILELLIECPDEELNSRSVAEPCVICYRGGGRPGDALREKIRGLTHFRIYGHGKSSHGGGIGRCGSRDPSNPLIRRSCLLECYTKLSTSWEDLSEAHLRGCEPSLGSLDDKFLQREACPGHMSQYDVALALLAAIDAFVVTQ